MNPKSKKESIVVQENDGETLIYNTSTQKAYLLNESAAFVWNNCDGNRDAGAIAKELAEKYKHKVDEDIVWLAIDQLNRESLMTEAGDIPAVFNKKSRREVIKRLGLGAVIALPTITSLIAPVSADAASTCLSAGQTGCLSGTPCCPNLTCNRDEFGGTCTNPPV